MEKSLSPIAKKRGKKKEVWSIQVCFIETIRYYKVVYGIDYQINDVYGKLL